MLLDASLYSAAALYSGVFQVPTLCRAAHCSLLTLFPLLFVVVLPLIYTDGQLLAVGRLLRYVSGRQQVG